jgi:hypothetical protein
LLFYDQGTYQLIISSSQNLLPSYLTYFKRVWFIHGLINYRDTKRHREGGRAGELNRREG